MSDDEARLVLHGMERFARLSIFQNTANSRARTFVCGCGVVAFFVMLGSPKRLGTKARIPHHLREHLCVGAAPELNPVDEVLHPVRSALADESTDMIAPAQFKKAA
jgi:hypothetical protein